jgi:hypothetical protein
MSGVRPEDFSRVKAALTRSAKAERKARKKAARRAAKIAEVDLVLRSDLDRAVMAKYRRRGA